MSTYKWKLTIEITASPERVGDGFDPGAFVRESYPDEAVRRIAQAAEWGVGIEMRITVDEEPPNVDVRREQGYAD